MATEKQIDKYWKERIDNRQYTAEQLGIKAEVEIIKIYEKALRNINQDIADVYEKYASKVGLGVDELSILLNSKEQSDFTRSIQSKMQKLGFNIENIYLPNYIARLSRLDALKQQIYWKIAEIGAEEEPIHEELYTKIVKDTYKQYQKDVVNVGIKPTFATLDNRMVNQMVKERWYGRNYSDSVWQNTTKLAETLPEKIGAALTMGRSYMKTANELLPLVSEEFDNAMYAATRLVRTETIFHLNQAEAQASVDDGYSEYEYYAKVGSERTCEICEDLDGRTFKYTELKVGVNYPPIHPNCRCNTRSAAKLTVPQMEKLSTKELKERYQISGGRIVPILPELPLSEVQTGELTVAGDIEERWKQSSAVKSKDKYNDEMNRISKLPTEEFKKKFDVLIKKVPEDYPLRKSLINTAKMIGWQEKIDLLQEAKKYKTPEEFAKNMVNAYHGTPYGEKEEFVLKKDGRTRNETSSLGIWLTPQKEVAELFSYEYEDSFMGIGGERKGKQGAIMGVYYDLKNPKVYETTPPDPELDVKLEELAKRMGAEQTRRMIEGDNSGEAYRRMIKLEEEMKDLRGQRYTDAFEKMMNDRDKFASYTMDNKRWYDRISALKVQETNEKFINSLREQGYDGIIMKNSTYDTGGTGLKEADQIVVFDPKQVYTRKQLTDVWEQAYAKAVPNEEEENILTSVNPTGTVFTKYDAKTRATAKLADNITTLDKTMEADPDEVVTIYRGVPAKYKEINAGDFVTTNRQLAKDYAGNGVVLEKQVKLSELLDDKDEPLGEEYIYRPKEEKEVAKKSAPKKVDKDLEQDLEAFKNIRKVETGGRLAWTERHKEDVMRNFNIVQKEFETGRLTEEEFNRWKQFNMQGTNYDEVIERLKGELKKIDNIKPEEYKEVRDKKEKELTTAFNAIGVTGELSDFEKRIAVAADVKLSEATGTKKRGGTLAYYSPDTKIIEYTKKGLKTSTDIGLNNTFFHEFGHAIDYNYKATSNPENLNKKLSDTKDWFEVLKKDPNEIVIEVKDRLEWSGNLVWKGRTLEEIKTVLAGGFIKVDGTPVALPRGHAKYLRRKEEIFARTYALYRTKNEEFRDKMPNIFKYFDELTGYEQQ